MKISCLILSLLLATASLAAESELGIGSDALLVQGFARKISASEQTGYRSHTSYASQAMIIHDHPGNDRVEWESAALPDRIGKPYVEFVWIGATSGVRKGKPAGVVRLAVDGNPVIDFETAGAKTWTVRAKNGVQVSFSSVRSDEHDDRFGYMKLRVPVKIVRAGSPVRISIEPVNESSNSWVMVFESPVLQSDSLDSRFLPTVRRGTPDKRWIRLGYYHFGKPCRGEITLCGKRYAEQIGFGFNEFEFAVDSVWASRRTEAELHLPEQKVFGTLEAYPLRKWEADFIHITHTDIGYTRPQPEVLAEHVRYLDCVLDYCDRTDDYPREAQFHWTCEGTWAVEAFLQSRPQSQVDRFIRRVKEGRIELTAMYFNFDGLTDEHSLAASLAPHGIFRKYGLGPIRVAMQNDVNGIGWCMSEYLGDLGVKYLTMGVNNDSGIPPFKGHTFFWWVSPSGRRIMTYYGAHYMDGNVLGIHEGDFSKFESLFLAYLDKCAREGYAYDKLGIEYLGARTDNASPSPVPCDIVKEWNEKYEWPKIRLAPFGAYMSDIERTYGDRLPEIRGAWPDWWSYGFGSGMRETAAVRRSHGEMIANKIMLALAKIAGSEVPQRLLDECREATNTALFYDEHTYGYFASINNPFGAETMVQRSIKASYAWEASRRSNVLAETAVGYINQFVTRQSEPSIVVYNPLSWSYSGKASAFVDYTVIPVNGAVDICDEEGRPVPFEVLRKKRDGAFVDFWVEDVPALGYKQFVIKPRPAQKAEIDSNPMKDGQVSNSWYDIAFDLGRGAIRQIYDRDLGADLLDPQAPYLFGELIHEMVKRRSFNEQIRKRRDGEPVTDTYMRCTPTDISPAAYSETALWRSWRFGMHTDAGMGEGRNVEVEYRLYKQAKKIEVLYNLTKKLETSPEGVYVAFPYVMDEGLSYCEVPGGEIEVGVDQIPGTSNDWYEVQSYAAVRGKGRQIVMGSPQIPMMEFGAINTGRFTYGAKPQSNQIYSFVLNNYWTTNFNADQHGGMKWSYYITSINNTSAESAAQWARGNTVPVRVRAMTGEQLREYAPLSRSFLRIEPSNLLLVGMEPIEGENAVMLQLREIEGRNSVVNIEVNGRKEVHLEPVNVIGVMLPGEGLEIKAYATKFVKVSW